jgi:hypothetical protein
MNTDRPCLGLFSSSFRTCFPSTDRAFKSGPYAVFTLVLSTSR